MSSKALTTKRGRPTKYKKVIPDLVTDYIKKCLKSGDYPTIQQLATNLEVGTRTIYEWETQYSEFSQTLEELRQAQIHMLITGGLNDKYNSRFAMFLLKASHGFVDSKPIVEATQNNTFNVSPEILAEAIIRSRENEAKDLHD